MTGTLAILQARMSSSRLPGKVLKSLLGEPMIGRHLERLRRCRRIDRLVVATSELASDDPLAEYCERLGALVHRGPLEDVLGRFCGALDAFGPAEHVVRLTADCPLADPDVIDACVELHLATEADYTSNGLQRSYPVGLDVEVMRSRVLLQACTEAIDPYEREHVTAFIYRHPEQFRLTSLTQAAQLGHLRWTVDTADDFTFVDRVYRALYPASSDFTSQQVLDLTAAWPGPWGGGGVSASPEPSPGTA